MYLVILHEDRFLILFYFVCFVLLFCFVFFVSIIFIYFFFITVYGSSGTGGIETRGTARGYGGARGGGDGAGYGTERLWSGVMSGSGTPEHPWQRRFAPC